MKKITRLLLICLLIVSIFTLIACGKDVGGNGNSSGNENNSGNENEQVYLTEGLTFDEAWQILKDADSVTIDYNGMDTVENEYHAIYKLSNNGYKIITDEGGFSYVACDINHEGKGYTLTADGETLTVHIFNVEGLENVSDDELMDRDYIFKNMKDMTLDDIKADMDSEDTENEWKIKDGKLILKTTWDADCYVTYTFLKINASKLTEADFDFVKDYDEDHIEKINME